MYGSIALQELLFYCSWFGKETRQCYRSDRANVRAKDGPEDRST